MVNDLLSHFKTQYTGGDSGFFYTSKYQGIVRSTIFGVFEDLKFEISDGYKQKLQATCKI